MTTFRDRYTMFSLRIYCRFKKKNFMNMFTFGKTVLKI